MKKIILFAMALLPLSGIAGCTGGNDDQSEQLELLAPPTDDSDDKAEVRTPTITFDNQALAADPENEGAKILQEVLGSDPQAFFKEHITKVVNTLYNGGDDPLIPQVNSLKIIISTTDYNGGTTENGFPAWATTSGTERTMWFWPGYITEFAAQWNNDPEVIAQEISGIAFHELTHTFQQSNPQGTVGSGPRNALIEGMADAVRPLNIPFPGNAPAQAGGNWDGAYRTTGWFLIWIKNTYDPDFIRKFNATVATLNPWSWDAALKSALGDQSATANSLWAEYQRVHFGVI